MLISIYQLNYQNILNMLKDFILIKNQIMNIYNLFLKEIKIQLEHQNCK